MTSASQDRGVFCRIAGLMLGVLLVACLTGCATHGGPEDSDLPWSVQESWEGSPSLPGGIGGGGGPGGGL